MTKELTKFLRESNLIEGVRDRFAIHSSLLGMGYALGCDEMKFTDIMKIHQIVMEPFKHLMDSEKGFLRNCDVWVGGNKMPSADEIGYQLMEWCEKYRKNPAKTSEECRQAHIEFEKAHVFLDGNGRVGRIVWQWQRIKANLPVKIIHEKDKYIYYKIFRDLDGETFTHESYKEFEEIV